MQTVALAQVQAMLTETVAMNGGDSRDSIAVMTLGLRKGDDRLARFKELGPIFHAVSDAAPQIKKGTIAIDETIWQKFEDIYYRNVVMSLFA